MGVGDRHPHGHRLALPVHEGVREQFGDRRASGVQVLGTSPKPQESFRDEARLPCAGRVSVELSAALEGRFGSALLRQGGAQPSAAQGDGIERWCGNRHGAASVLTYRPGAMTLCATGV
nr:hypothetical protein [Streptomyces sp. NBC_01214]